MDKLTTVGGWGDQPTILIMADDAGARADATAAAEGAGARVIGSVGIAAALDRLDRQVALDGLLIELHADGGAAQDDLLDRINAAVRDGGAPAVVSMPTSLIDAVTARIDQPSIVLLCEPSMDDRVAALGLALAERRHRLHDSATEPDSSRLRRLSEEVGRIARSLAELSGAHAPAANLDPRPSGEHRGADRDGLLHAGMVRGVIRLRRLRSQFFAEVLFADPAWDMLLDLMAARLERTEVAVSSLCIAAAVPATTALRWIRTMTEHGLFVRSADPQDGRRVFIALSEGAADAMASYFEIARQIGWRPLNSDRGV